MNDLSELNKAQLLIMLFQTVFFFCAGYKSAHIETRGRERKFYRSIMNYFGTVDNGVTGMLDDAAEVASDFPLAADFYSFAHRRS